MLESMDHWQLRAALEWQAELGAEEALGDMPVNRYETQAPEVSAPISKGAAPSTGQSDDTSSTPVQEMAASTPAGPDPVVLAKEAAGSAGDLQSLRAALEVWEHCELKRGARNMVFADGNPVARLMIIGEAPGRDEDRQGLPFVGAAGQLLNRMLAAIDMARDATDAEKSVYITNVLPWRPPHNREPKPGEIEQMRPFVTRHIELVQPDVLIVMGNIACEALLGKRGITRLRGKWAETQGVPAMPMFHPAYLLRTPEAKRDAWHDLLQIRARLRG